MDYASLSESQGPTPIYIKFRAAKAESQNPSSQKYPSPSGRGGTVTDDGWGPWKSTFRTTHLKPDVGS